jgi:hypothetical protein
MAKKDSVFGKVVKVLEPYVDADKPGLIEVEIEAPSAERKERCETCRFWEQWEANIQDCEADPEIPEVGQCKRYPPLCCDSSGNDVRPSMSGDDWCGEWKASETQARVPISQLTSGGNQADKELVLNILYDFPDLQFCDEITERHIGQQRKREHVKQRLRDKLKSLR